MSNPIIKPKPEEIGDIEKEIEAWVQQTASKQCSKCIDSCCDGVKHFIDVADYELDPFLEIGVPVFNLEYFDPHNILLKWRQEGLSDKLKLFTKEGTEIPKPSLIETKEYMYDSEDGIKFQGKSKFTLYVDKYCPFYNQTKGCEIHDDSRRPVVCKKYPVFKLAGSDNEYIIKPSCQLFNLREIREDFRRNFPQPKVLLLINSKTPDGRNGYTFCFGDINKREYGVKIT